MLKQYLPLIIPVLLFAFILRRSAKATKVRLRAMWIRPVIILILTGVALYASPIPSLIVLAAFAGALLLGAGVGYLRARHLELSIDPATGEISSKASQIGTIIIGALFLVRYGLKIAFPQLAMQPGGHAEAAAIAFTNGALIFTVAMISTQAVLIWLRTRPLLAEHKARVVPPPIAS